MSGIDVSSQASQLQTPFRRLSSKLVDFGFQKILHTRKNHRSKNSSCLLANFSPQEIYPSPLSSEVPGKL